MRAAISQGKLSLPLVLGERWSCETRSPTHSRHSAYFGQVLGIEYLPEDVVSWTMRERERWRRWIVTV